MMTRPLLLAVLIYGLLLAGLAALNGALLVLAIPLILYLGTGLLFAPAQVSLSASRSLSADRAWPNEPVTVRLTVANQGSRLETVHLVDPLPESLQLVAGQAAWLISLGPGQSLDLAYTVSGGRGVYRFGGVQANAGETLGLFSRRLSLAAPGQFFVLPEVIRLRRAEIRPRATRVYSGQIPARQGGPGVEFFGVREYQPGDPLRWLNERASARHSQALFVNEFEQERVADVGLILDARQQSNAVSGRGSLFEYSVQAAAALAEAFLKGGNRVGLFIYGRYLDWTLPGYGKVQRERILRALARAEPDDSPVFARLEHLPTRLFPARSQLVLVSPLLPDDLELLVALRARGYRLLVISPDPIAFEQPGLARRPAVDLAIRLARLERELLLRQLRQADIRVINWPVETPFQQIAHVALSRFQRF